MQKYSYILLFNLFVIGNGFYWIITLPGAIKIVSENAQRVHSFDPANIIWVNKLSDVYQRAALSTSIIGVAVIVPVIANPSSTLTIRSVSMAWLVIVWSLVIIPYWIAQTHISNFIREEQLLNMMSIQRKMYKLIINHSESTGFSEYSIDFFGQLLELYTKMQTYDKSAWKIKHSLKFINSLFIPLLSFILVNFSIIIDFLHQIIQLFFR